MLILMVLVVVGTAVASRRQRQRANRTPSTTTVADTYPRPTRRGESLARAAEVGLAEIGDLSREPREAIIACYAAMERELTHVPGAVPQDCDTPSEVLARAVDNHALRADSATQLVELFEEARFCPHVMNEGHRDAAVRVWNVCLPSSPDSLREHRMKKLVAAGFLVVAGVELMALAVLDRRAGPRRVRRRGRAARCSTVRWYLVREPESMPANARRRRRGVVAPLAVSDRDVDQPVGVHAQGLGPAPASHAWPGSSRWPPDRSRPRTARPFNATGQHAFRCGAVGVGRPENVSRDRRRASPAPAARRSTKFCNGWSGYDGEYDAPPRPPPRTARRCSTRLGTWWSASAAR